MSGHPQGDHYDDGYGHAPQGHDSYYQDDHNQGYYDQHQDYQQHPQGGDGYYDESYVSSSVVLFISHLVQWLLQRRRQ